jgi:DNA repair exonuclease SbcCD ATPase subunit
MGEKLMQLQEYKEQLFQYKGQYQLLSEKRKQLNLDNSIKTQYLENLEKVQTFLQKIAQDTQEQLRYRITDIVNIALETVFPNETKFNIEFKVARGKTECRLIFTEEEEEIDPLDASAGGFINVTSFALRIVAWLLGTTRNTIILDEPFVNLSSDLVPLAAEVLKELSKELKLQMIIVTHDKEIIGAADKIFEVSRVKEGKYLVSKVKEVIK